MSQSRLAFGGVILAVFLIILNNAVFALPETKSAVILRFGAPIRFYVTAGLKFKMPFTDTVQFIDKRNRGLDQPAIQIIASNQERLEVDAFARYRIVDPQAFYQQLGNEKNGEARLSQIMSKTLLAVLGEVTTDQIVSTDRAALMLRIRNDLAVDARPYGIEIIDVKIRRADLPTENSAAVFKRMITERTQQAQKTRAEGTASAQEIRASADRKATEEIAKAEEEAQKIKGAADAERSAVFAAAYGKDPEFYAFYRSLQAYEAALKPEDSTLVVSPDSDFFRYFAGPRGKR